MFLADNETPISRFPAGDDGGESAVALLTKNATTIGGDNFGCRNAESDLRNVLPLHDLLLSVVEKVQLKRQHLADAVLVSDISAVSPALCPPNR